MYLARSGLPSVPGKKNFPESLKINPLLTCLFGQNSIDIGKFMDLDSISVHEHAKKKKLANSRPS